MKLRALCLAIAFFGMLGVSNAQQTPTHSLPVGRGPGATGFNSIGPCASGVTVAFQGASSDPICATPLAFYLHKNGSAQTGMTTAAYVQVTWSTSKFLTGGTFASNRWTATIAGYIQMDVALYWSAHAASTANPIFTVKIIKNSAGTCNGADVFAGQGTPVTGFPTTAIAAAGGVDQVTAGDVYEVCAFGTSNTPANDLQLDGNQAHTHWSGAYLR